MPWCYYYLADTKPRQCVVIHCANARIASQQLQGGRRDQNYVYAPICCDRQSCEDFNEVIYGFTPVETGAKCWSKWKWSADKLYWHNGFAWLLNSRRNRTFPHSHLPHTHTRAIVDGKRIINTKREHKHLINTNSNLPTTCKYPTWLIIGFVLTCIRNNKSGNIWMSERVCGMANTLNDSNWVFCCDRERERELFQRYKEFIRKPKTNKGTRIKVIQVRPAWTNAAVVWWARKVLGCNWCLWCWTHTFACQVIFDSTHYVLSRTLLCVCVWMLDAPRWPLPFPLNPSHWHYAILFGQLCTRAAFTLLYFHASSTLPLPLRWPHRTHPSSFINIISRSLVHSRRGFRLAKFRLYWRQGTKPNTAQTNLLRHQYSAHLCCFIAVVPDIVAQLEDNLFRATVPKNRTAAPHLRHIARSPFKWGGERGPTKQ